MDEEIKRLSEQKGAGSQELLFRTWIVVAIISLSSIAVAFLYWHQFHEPGVGFSSDQDIWAEFGEYLGGVLGPVLAFINLLVLARTSFDFRKQDRKSQKAQNLFELHQRWTALYTTRQKAFAFLKAQPHFTLLDVHNHPRQDPDNNLQALWEVLGFFEALEFAAEEGVVDEIQMVTLFGQVYVWWWLLGVKQDYPVNWDYKQRHRALFLRFERLEKDEIRKWLQYANADFEKYNPEPKDAQS